MLIRRAGEQGADIIVCPEMATSGYIWPDEQSLHPHAESAQGPTLATLSPLAKAFGAWIVCGFPEQDRGLLFNAALVVAPDGSLSHCYRKMLLYTADMHWACPGGRRVVCDTAVGRMAPAICMDLNDNELLRFVGQANVDVLAFCTNWIEENSDVHAYWRWRLSRWSGWLVAANTWGEDSGTVFSGRSAIMAPSGAVVAQSAATGDDVLVVDTAELTEKQLRAPPRTFFWPW